MNEHVRQLDRALREFLPLVKLRPGQIIVIGCSTSEVLGHNIGKGSSKELGEKFFLLIQGICLEYDLRPAFQCCEHLNRAVVVDRDTMLQYALTEVSVIPVPGAGGSMAAAAFKGLKEPVVVESIQAHAGIDIGDTFIGMHLKPVAVPVRISMSQIGQAHLTLARTRPKLIGGARAMYEDSPVKGTCN